MKWFYKWLRNKLDDSQYAPEAELSSMKNIGLAKPRRINTIRESDDLNTEPITFKMFKASGGWAIEFRQYDNRNDRVDTSLYVVTDENELGKHISQIITMEALKR